MQKDNLVGITRTLEELSELIDGQIRGVTNKTIDSLCPVDQPRKGAIAFTRERVARKIRQYLDSGIEALIVTPQADLSLVTANDSIVVVKDPIRAISMMAPIFYVIPPVFVRGISPKAEIDPSAKIGKNVSIGAFAVIGPDVEIGDDCKIFPHVVLYPGAKIGARSVLHSGVTVRENSEVGPDNIIQNGSVIGGDGFGYYLGEDNQLKSVPQYGKAILSRGVEVGANSCIDKGTISNTTIGPNTKIDNIVQVGHNVQVGTNSLLCAMVGIAGSAKIGNYVTLAGHVGVADQIVVVDGCRVGGKSAVTRSLLEKGDYIGYPAVKVGSWRRIILLQTKMPEIVKKLNISLNLNDEK